MIPLVLVTGFLGSGKTTLLRRLARQADRRLVFLVNDFSPADVDGKQLGEVASDVVSIAGGSIFCRCLVTEFIGALRGIPERFGPALDGVVVEASGIADPNSVGTMLRETGLDRTFRLARIVCLVDPGTFLKLLAVLPNIEAQVRAADILLINKAGAHPPEQVAETEARVLALNPRARRVRTDFAEVDLDLFGDGASPAPCGDYTPCRDPHYARVAVAWDRPPDLDRLRRDLAALGPDLYRVKGWVPTLRGGVFLDGNGLSMAEQPAPPGPEPRLALILAAAAGPQAEALLATHSSQVRREA